MDSARFRRIEELYHSALEREPAQRDSVLQHACGNDAELRREVQGLLAPLICRMASAPAVDSCFTRTLKWN